MVKAMKVMKTKAVTAMPKSGIFDHVATKTGLKKKEVSGVVEQLVTLATAEVKTTGKFTLPGLCMLKTRVKPARKAGTTTAFGKTMKVKARPAQKIVKAYVVAALKKSI
jgi:nucleoid DNA-binding protein